MFDSIGFIGAGRVTSIMLAGWLRAGVALPRVRVADVSAEALDRLRDEFPWIEPATSEEAAAQSLVFVALHPPVLAETLARIAPCLRPDAVLVSLAPKLRLPGLQQQLGGFARLARMNPNATSVIASGYNPIAFADGLAEDARKALLALVQPLGRTPVVPDEQIETYAVVSAMAPTYFWFQFDTLRRLALEFGLSEEMARQTVREVLHGAVDTLLASDLQAERVMDLVPVRPLAEEEDKIRALLCERIRAIHAKLNAR